MLKSGLIKATNDTLTYLLRSGRMCKLFDSWKQSYKQLMTVGFFFGFFFTFALLLIQISKMQLKRWDIKSFTNIYYTNLHSLDTLLGTI